MVPTVYLHCLAREQRCQAHSPGKSRDTKFSAEEAAKHRKTKVPGQADQMTEPLTQLLILPTAWEHTLTRCSVYVRTQPEQSAAEEK